MLDTTKCEEYFKKVQEFAKKVDKEDNLKEKLDWLATYACHIEPGDSEAVISMKKRKTKCVLFSDFAPASFEFAMYRQKPTGEYEFWFNGGLIYHGPHDGWGSGAGPTFSVTLTPTNGWSVHT